VNNAGYISTVFGIGGKSTFSVTFGPVDSAEKVPYQNFTESFREWSPESKIKRAPKIFGIVARENGV